MSKEREEEAATKAENNPTHRTALHCTVTATLNAKLKQTRVMGENVRADALVRGQTHQQQRREWRAVGRSGCESMTMGK